MKISAYEKLNKCNVIQNLAIDFESAVAISGRLVCNCGCEKFNIYHSGRRTKGILAPYIVPVRRQLYIKAKCVRCNKEIVLVDNQRDIGCLDMLEIKKEKELEIICKLNYLPENLKDDTNAYTNRYEELYIYAKINGKEIAVFE